MKKTLTVKEAKLVEVCDRCETKPATTRLDFKFAAADFDGDAVGLKSPKFVCDGCFDIITNSFTIHRKKKATPDAPATLGT